MVFHLNMHHPDDFMVGLDWTDSSPCYKPSFEEL